MQGESMEMHKVRIISLPPKAVSIQDGMKKLQWNKASLPYCIDQSQGLEDQEERTKLRTPTPGQALGGGEESETPPKLCLGLGLRQNFRKFKNFRDFQKQPQATP
ncbi:hypothetical protein T06_1842 [Trichinella sp. T6]|nr:hypothetical protein T06_1842 [Trichinella sp. T6]